MPDVEVVESTSVELATRQSLVPDVAASELVKRLAVISEAMQTAMVAGVDYGNIPGTDKPALLKPGAEKLGVLFQLDVQLANDKTWGPGDHLTVESKAIVYHVVTGSRLGFGEGMCSTREKKYAYRQQERTCPTCGKPAIIKGKAEYGGGWVCFKKKGGCGAKFADSAQEIVGQTVGQVDNPDLPDLWNTVVKMAEKRARVDAVLAVTGASALFTQDIELDDSPVEPAPLAAEPTDIAHALLSHEERVALQSHVDAMTDPARLLADCGAPLKSREWTHAHAAAITSAISAELSQQSDVPVDPTDFQPVAVSAETKDDFARLLADEFDGTIEEKA